MIDLFMHPSQNIVKVLMFLEEAKVEYRLHNDRVLEPGSAEMALFQKASPTGQVPAIYDQETGVALFESAAILLYLAEKTGHFLPEDQPARSEVQKWLIFEAASITPPLLQLYHLICWAPEPHPFMEERNRDLLKRALDTVNAQLDGKDYIACEYSIADMVLYPWMSMLEDMADLELSDFPNLAAWTARLKERPAVQRAEAVTV